MSLILFHTFKSFLSSLVVIDSRIPIEGEAWGCPGPLNETAHLHLTHAHLCWYQGWLCLFQSLGSSPLEIFLSYYASIYTLNELSQSGFSSRTWYLWQKGQFPWESLSLSFSIRNNPVDKFHFYLLSLQHLWLFWAPGDWTWTFYLLALTMTLSYYFLFSVSPMFLCLGW